MSPLQRAAEKCGARFFLQKRRETKKLGRQPIPLTRLTF
jgi:hypothetical protein